MSLDDRTIYVTLTGIVGNVVHDDHTDDVHDDVHDDNVYDHVHDNVQHDVHDDGATTAPRRHDDVNDDVTMTSVRYDELHSPTKSTTTATPRSLTATIQITSRGQTAESPGREILCYVSATP